MDNLKDDDYRIDDALDILKQRDERKKVEEKEFEQKVRKEKVYKMNRDRKYYLAKGLKENKETIKAEVLLALSSLVSGSMCLTVNLATNMGLFWQTASEATGFIFVIAGAMTVLNLPSTIVAKQKIKEIKQELAIRENIDNNHLKR